jgi:tRNA U34 5-methylaminomethyl-2-thiouridine-forming methyltransferase MnmC
LFVATVKKLIRPEKRAGPLLQTGTHLQTPLYLVNEHYNDRYFDVINAVEEAGHIFFNGCGIPQVLLDRAPDLDFKIGETGFGAGRVLVSLLDVLERSGIVGRSIIYNSVELHPLAPNRMASILEGFRSMVGPHIDMLVKEYRVLDPSSPGWHTAQFKGAFGTLTLRLFIGEALEMVDALEAPCDAWFLDGHGPQKNPAMWRPELLTAIGKKTVTGGRCATYTVAGAVRRALGAAGFIVEKVPGYGGKRLVLRGVKT